MKKQIIILSSAVVISLVMGYSINNIAISKAQPEYKIATVDIQKIVANSTEIKSLKTEQTGVKSPGWLKNTNHLPL